MKSVKKSSNKYLQCLQVERAKRHKHYEDPAVIFDHLNTLCSEDGPLVAIIGPQPETKSGVNEELVGLPERTKQVEERLSTLEKEITEIKAFNASFHKSDEVLELQKKVNRLEEECGRLDAFCKSLVKRLDILEKGGGQKPNYNDEEYIRRREDYSESSPIFRQGGMSQDEKTKFLEDKIIDVERTTNILSVHHSELELQLQASLASTYTGTFLWRIPDVRRRQREARAGKVSSIYSPPFYTGRTGYKMCVRAYLNGDGSGEGQYLSIFFVVMKGEYDALLAWPFDCKVSKLLFGKEQEN